MAKIVDSTNIITIHTEGNMRLNNAIKRTGRTPCKKLNNQPPESTTEIERNKEIIKKLIKRITLIY